MDYISLSNRRKSSILIISILVHILLMLLIFAGLMSDENSWYNPRRLFEPATVLPQSPITSPQATVIFQDNPQGTPGEPEPFQPAPAAQTQIPSPPMEEPVETTEPTQEPATQLASAQELAGEDAAQEKPQEVAASEERSSELEEKSLDAALSVAHEVEQKAPAAKSSARTHHAPQKLAMPGTQGLSIGDITRGFLQSQQQEHGRTPQGLDGESLARQRYSTRVWSILKNAYRAHRAPTYLLSDLSTQANLVLQLNKRGQLISISLEHPNKTHDLYEVEQLIVRAAKKAGLYPPIPPTFKADTITLSYPLMISIKEGVHTYDFIYQ